MSDDSWQRLQAWFEQARAMAAPERKAFVAGCVQQDAALARQLQDLLDQATGKVDPVPGLLSKAARLAVDGQRNGWIGRRLGPWRVVAHLADGGMGVVWLAERADGGFEQKVAIKLLATGAASAQAHARFLAERQLLARLEHPHIARLVDGGSTDDGVPYLAIEYVDGQPITQYCDSLRLPIKARLELFRQVCAAVQVAHQHLVVHRDIKPSNILVTADGTPKLLDFGIAKLLDQAASTGDGLRTEVDVRLLTPRYASPEQVKGEPVSTATDVHALGLLLYELCCGVPAFAGGDGSVGALERAIVEQQPMRPSLRLAQTDAEGTASAARSTSRRKLQAQLRGDLDTIVGMALRKEPARRYASVEALSADVDRMLRQLPVLARPDAWSYRSSRFLRRHAWASAAAAVAAVLAVAFVVSTRVQLERIDRERLVATRTADFLVDLFRAADPFTSDRQQVTLKQVLERGATQVDQQLADAPAVRVRMLHAIGSALSSLGELEQGERLLRQAVELHEGIQGAPTAAAGTRWFELGRVLWRLGRLDDALQAMTRGADIHRTTLAPDDPVHAQNESDRAGVYWSTGRLRDAHASMQRVVAIWRAQPEAGPDLASALANLALTEWELGLFRDGARHAGQAIELLNRLRHAGHPHHGSARKLMGSLQRRLGQPAQANALYRQALAHDEQVLGPRHRDVADDLRYVADSERELGRSEAAVAIIERALQVAEQAVGADHDDFADSLVVAAHIDHTLGRQAAARTRLARAIAILERNRGPDFPRLVPALTVLAAIERDAGQPARALPLLQRALDITAKGRGEAGPWVADVVTELALVQLQLGRVDEAWTLAQRAQGLRGAPADDPLAAARDAEVRAEVQLRRGQRAEAEAAWRAARATYEAAYGAAHPLSQRVAQRPQAEAADEGS